jgi:hypothetical protein
MKLGRYLLYALLAGLTITAASCRTEETEIEGNPDEAAAQQTAEQFVRNSPTYTFDGMDGTLDLVDSVNLNGENAWQFTWEFTSSQSGYGDRTDQMLNQVLTPHSAVITVENGAVTRAVMDEQWDMIEQRMLDGEMETEIKIAPIDNVEVAFMESYPIQVGVTITVGLPDGCTSFHDAVVTREANTITIEVTNQRPKDMFCTAVYTTTDEFVNLGSDFTPGETYTLKVNEYLTEFEYY